MNSISLNHLHYRVFFQFSIGERWLASKTFDQSEAADAYPNGIFIRCKWNVFQFPFHRNPSSIAWENVTWKTIERQHFVFKWKNWSFFGGFGGNETPLAAVRPTGARPLICIIQSNSELQRSIDVSLLFHNVNPSGSFRFFVFFSFSFSFRASNGAKPTRPAGRCELLWFRQ